VRPPRSRPAAAGRSAARGWRSRRSRRCSARARSSASARASARCAPRWGPNIEALPPGDPRRAAFGRLHGVSVLLMGAAGLAAGGALVLTGVAAARAR
jgi:hypothetical protein